ncbi:MAG TPA: iron-containing alcohol dehydrogenase, partial [Candidatus Paceibacterota bacterium]|nr:iron-containing alcohol dehydrogenase [Candidatus Paceibacterota bacterium]
YSFSHEFLLPRYAVIDAELTYSLPPNVTADSGMDALAQAIEAFWSTNATPESKEYSRQAIQLILPNFVIAVNSPIPQAREAMAQGAHLAGKAINIAKTTACHALSYPFTVHYGVAHGHAVGLTLPEMIEYNAKTMEKADLQELVLLLGAKTPAQAANNIRSLMQEISLETTLRELGITDLRQIQELVLKEVNTERLGNNPRLLAPDDIRAILAKIF